MCDDPRRPEQCCQNLIQNNFSIKITKKILKSICAFSLVKVSAREMSCTPIWENAENKEMEKMYLQAETNEDRLELELETSALRVHHNSHSNDTS